MHRPFFDNTRTTHASASRSVLCSWADARCAGDERGVLAVLALSHFWTWDVSSVPRARALSRHSKIWLCLLERGCDRKSVSCPAEPAARDGVLKSCRHDGTPVRTANDRLDILDSRDSMTLRPICVLQDITESRLVCYESREPMEAESRQGRVPWRRKVKFGGFEWVLPCWLWLWLCGSRVASAEEACSWAGLIVRESRRSARGRVMMIRLPADC
jgi:hypothetical protein